jgi:hypothetical protein
MNEKGICYFFVYDKISIPGVHKKILGTLESAMNNGYQVRQYSSDSKEKPTFVKMLLEIIKCNEKILIVRSIFYLNFVIMPFVLIARVQGKKIYCDVPSSFKSALYEIFDHDCHFFVKIKYLLGTFLGASWSLIPYNYIITYSEDYTFFSFAQKYKTLLLTNSISLSQISPRRKYPVWPSNRLNLVAVAFVSNYHGYDRVLRSIYDWNNKNNNYKVFFTIIGDGSAIPYLKQLAAKLKIENYIIFKGILTFQNILPIYENSHIAVGSIGLHRKKMNLHSELKAREYAAVGIPFISSGNDLDFSKDQNFRIVISTDDEFVDLINLYANIDKFLSSISIQEITDFAKNNLTFNSKFNKLKINE